MKLFRKSRHEEKYHSHHMRDPRAVRSPQEQYQERHHRHKRHYQPQHHPAVPNQYEYVRREHGFDYMPPSQYVPSRSISEDSEDIFVDPPIKVQVPGSELSLSVGQSVDPFVDKRHKTPVVRGKPVRTKSSSGRKDRRLETSHPVLQAIPQPRDTRQEHEGDHMKSRHYKSRQRDESSYHHRETTQIKSRTRSDPDYRDEVPAVGRQSPREMVQAGSRRGKSPILPEVGYRGQEPPSVQHSRQSKREDDRSFRPEYSREEDFEYGSPPSIQKVPTAFSYHSEDSIENPHTSVSRYGLSDEEKGYRQIIDRRTRENGPSHWERHVGKAPSHGMDSQGIDLDALHGPSYEKKNNRRESDSVTGRIIVAPIDSRVDTHHRRRRSRDVRDPVEVFEPPLGLERPENDMDEFDVELSIGSYPDEVYYENPLMEQGYDRPYRRHASTGRTRGDEQAKDKKKKTKGFFGRIRDSVMKEKGGKRVVERAWDQDLRGKGSLFENSADSFETETPSHPPYPRDARSSRAPIPPDDKRYYEQPPIRIPSRHVATPPRTRSRQESFERRRTRSVDYVYPEGPPEIQQLQASGKPFQSTRVTTPTLRANPDNRQRYGPMNTATPKQYRSQYQGIGSSGHPRGNQSPHLHYDATQVNNHQRRMRFTGC